MLNDQIADMLTRIRNGYLAKKEKVIIPFSNSKMAIIQVLVNNNYLKQVKLINENNKKNLEIVLLYKDNLPCIKKIIRVSRAGRRIYESKNNLPIVLSGLGNAIISTSKGIMTARQAKKQSLGGEIICKIW